MEPSAKPPIPKEKPKDTYYMAFKALNFKAAAEIGLETKEVMQAFQFAVFVFIFQLILMSIIFYEVLSDDVMLFLTSNIECLTARFLCTFLMHMMVESNVREGLIMMKYATNHRFDFVSSNNAFLIGLMQFTGGVGAEIVCILHLSRFDDAFSVVVGFIALTSISRVDDIVFSALATARFTFTKPSSQLQILMHKRDWGNLRTP